MLAGMGDLRALVVPATAGFEAAFAAKGRVRVPFLFETPDGEHSRCGR